SGETVAIDSALAPNQLFKKSLAPKLPEDVPYSQPYWLRQPGTVGTFNVSNQHLIGLPQNPPAFPVVVNLAIGGASLVFAVDTQHRSVDAGEGELDQALLIAPPVFANFANPVFVFPDEKAKSVSVRVIANAESVNGQVSLEAPTGWRFEPASVPISLKKIG